MECAKIKEFLSEYINGTLDAQNKALVEAHLLACKGCQEDLASLKAVVEELEQVAEVTAQAKGKGGAGNARIPPG